MIYVTGDMHGDIERFASKEFKQLEPHDTLIVAGDFGFVWDGSRKERRILKRLGQKKYNICFIDGPHDNYERIYGYRETIWRGGRVHRISGSLFHLCRGQIFNIEGCKIFTFGGGESTDKDIRSENSVWFKEELPTPQHMMTGAKNLDEVDCKVDYIITHEPPSVVKKAMQLRAGANIYTNKLNGFLEELNRSVQFRRWYFGSFHEDKIITNKHTAVFQKLIPINYDDLPLKPSGDKKYYDEEDDRRLEREEQSGESVPQNADAQPPIEETEPQIKLPEVNINELFVDEYN